MGIIGAWLGFAAWIVPFAIIMALKVSTGSWKKIEVWYEKSLNYTMSIERKLAAIVFTDIAGFTELSTKDEENAFISV